MKVAFRYRLSTRNVVTESLPPLSVTANCFLFLGSLPILVSILPSSGFTRPLTKARYT
jgi:hypothetical protein